MFRRLVISLLGNLLRYLKYIPSWGRDISSTVLVEYIHSILVKESKKNLISTSKGLDRVSKDLDSIYNIMDVLSTSTELLGIGYSFNQLLEDLDIMTSTVAIEGAAISKKDIPGGYILIEGRS